MALITRIFPAEKRGAAMGVWGTVAGVLAAIVFLAVVPAAIFMANGAT